MSQIRGADGYSFIIVDTLKPLEMGSGNGDTTNNELWLKNEKTGEKKLLVACRDAKDVKNEICDIRNPQFSLDRSEVFFESSAWATSGAIHSVEVKTGKERFVCDGNDLRVVDAGPYKGDLITVKHKYSKDPEGGSYDHYFVVDSRGKELVDLGEELDKEKLK